MVCRNKDKAEQAREVIVNESGNTVSVLFAMGLMMSQILLNMTLSWVL